MAIFFKKLELTVVKKENFVKKYLVVAAIAISGSASAVSVCKSCTVTGVQPDPRRGGTYIFMEGDWSDSTTSCTNTTTNKALFVNQGSALEEAIVSVALVGLTSGKTIGYAYGTGVCVEHQYETLDYIYIKQ